MRVTEEHKREERVEERITTGKGKEERYEVENKTREDKREY